MPSTEPGQHPAWPIRALPSTIKSPLSAVSDATPRRSPSAPKRFVTRARNELLEKHWICLPSGDCGGRAFSKETWLGARGGAGRVHLAPAAQPCGMQQSELKQRVAASRRMAGKGDNLSPLFTLAKGDNLSGKQQQQQRRSRLPRARLLL